MLLRYKDGEQEEELFYVPSIEIFFDPVLDIKRDIIERLPLGFCSCGKSIPIIQHLLRVNKGIESKSRITRLFARGDAIILGIRLKIFPVHKYSLFFDICD